MNQFYFLQRPAIDTDSMTNAVEAYTSIRNSLIDSLRVFDEKVQSLPNITSSCFTEVSALIFSLNNKEIYASTCKKYFF